MYGIEAARLERGGSENGFPSPIEPGLVSIVMPAYNVDRFVAEAIESVLAQTYERWQLVVVDDGSTDGTASIISRFVDPRILVVRQTNGGLTAARNTGLGKAAGEWILFFDSDDLLQPDALDVLVRASRPAGGERPAVVYGDYLRIAEDGTLLGRRDLMGRFRIGSRPTGDLLPFFLHGFVQMIGTSLIRADILRQVGPLPRGFEPMEDWVYFTRFALLGPFRSIDRVVMRYRMRHTSLSMTAGLDISRYGPALDAVFDDPNVRARFPARKLRALRAAREASIFNFIAAQSVRARNYRGARAAYLSSLRRSWRKGPKGAVMMALAAAGM